ncbi:MAG: DUF4340 domain-containing protein [Elusimicrobiales bacterium]
MKLEYRYALIVGALIIGFIIAKRIYEPQIYSNKDFSDLINTKDITKIEFEINQKKYTFEKRDGQWMITQPYRWKADSNQITNLITSLEKSKIYGPLTENEKLYERFEINQNSGKITLSSNKTISFLTGKEGQSFRSLFIKFSDKKPIYELNGISSFDLKKDPTNFIDKNLITFKDEEIEKISFNYANKEYTFSKKDSEWSDLKAKSIYEKLKNIRFSEITDEKINLNADLTLTLTSKSEVNVFNFIKGKDTYIVKTSEINFKLNEYDSKKIKEIKEILLK